MNVIMVRLLIATVIVINGTIATAVAINDQSRMSLSKDPILTNPKNSFILFDGILVTNSTSSTSMSKDRNVGDPCGRKATAIVNQSLSRVAATLLSPQVAVQLQTTLPATTTISNASTFAAGSDASELTGDRRVATLAHCISCHEKGTRHERESGGCIYFATLCMVAMCLFVIFLPSAMRRGKGRGDAEPAKACNRPALLADSRSPCCRHSTIPVVTITFMVMTQAAAVAGTTTTAAAPSLLRGAIAVLNSSALQRLAPASATAVGADPFVLKGILALKPRQSNTATSDAALPDRRQSSSSTAAVSLDEDKGKGVQSAPGSLASSSSSSGKRDEIVAWVCGGRCHFIPRC